METEHDMFEFIATKQALDSLQRLMTCCQCDLLTKNVCTLGNCEHIFCKQCVERHLGGCCPVCEQPAHARDARVQRQLSNIVSVSLELSRLLRHQHTKTGEEDGIMSPTSLSAEPDSTCTPGTSPAGQPSTSTEDLELTNTAGGHNGASITFTAGQPSTSTEMKHPSPGGSCRKLLNPTPGKRAVRKSKKDLRQTTMTQIYDEYPSDSSDDQRKTHSKAKERISTHQTRLRQRTFGSTPERKSIEAAGRNIRTGSTSEMSASDEESGSDMGSEDGVSAASLLSTPQGSPASSRAGSPKSAKNLSPTSTKNLLPASTKNASFTSTKNASATSTKNASATSTKNASSTSTENASSTSTNRRRGRRSQGSVKIVPGVADVTPELFKTPAASPRSRSRHSESPSASPTSASGPADSAASVPSSRQRRQSTPRTPAQKPRAKAKDCGSLSPSTPRAKGSGFASPSTPRAKGSGFASPSTPRPKGCVSSRSTPGHKGIASSPSTPGPKGVVSSPSAQSTVCSPVASPGGRRAGSKGMMGRVKRNAKGETPLHVAAIKGDISAIRELLSRGENPNVRDNAGWTPLHEAVNHGHTAVTEALLQHGAMVNMPGMDNDTPLHDAVINGRLDCVRLLVSYGASVTARNVHGRTAVELAVTEEMRSALLDTGTLQQMVAPAPAEPEDVEELRPLCFLGTALSRDQRGTLQKCASILHAKVVEDFCPEVTHVVSSVNREGQCPRTFKYLQAILSGKWIVSIEWVSVCLEYGEKVSEEPFEVAGSSTHPNSNAPHKARMNRKQQLPGLFDGCQMYLHGSFSHLPPSKPELMDLLQLGGAHVLTREPRLANLDEYEVTVPYHASPASSLCDCGVFIVHDGSSKAPTVHAHRMRSVPASWLVECIATFSLPEPEPAQCDITIQCNPVVTTNSLNTE